MLPEIGQFALMLALIFAALLGFFSFYGVWRKSLGWVKMAPLFTYLVAGFIFLSYAILTISFVENDFTVRYVAQHSSTLLPFLYRLSGVWGAHEGSMLLWVTILAFWMLLVALWGRKRLPPEILAQVLGVLGWVGCGFLFFIVATSNPFLRFLPFAPREGMDLNPLLQDPGFLAHPPMLYMGYVGFSVVFAIAIAALISGKFSREWARMARPWTLAAWCFLTLGITLGSWWAYRELGWGGFWFWDPVENASLMPWLVGTGLCHALLVVEKRGIFKAWTVFLAILAFSLSLLGTFLVRSGVLTSVHAFANDPKRGVVILLYLFLVVGGSLALFALRGAHLKDKQSLKWISREGLLLSQSIFLVVGMLTVLLGTLYPLVIQALGVAKLSVGAPYFNTVMVPLMTPFFFLMGVGPKLPWKQTGALNDARLKGSFLLSLTLAIVLPGLMAGTIQGYIVLGLTLAFWIVITNFQAIMLQDVSTRLTHKRRQWGMLLAHSGVAITLIGITLNTGLTTSQFLRMTVGDSTTLGAYSIQFKKIAPVDGPNYKSDLGEFEIKKQGKWIATIKPEKRFYTVARSSMTDAAVHMGWWSDLYIALGEPLGQKTWSVRIYLKPFVRWIWYGGLLMLLGGLLASTSIFLRNKKAAAASENRIGMTHGKNFTA